jgi:hypothetical protein
MQETSLENSLNTQWEKLNSSEKALINLYIKKLYSGGVSKKLVIEVNNIHDKYPDFHVGCAPTGNLNFNKK